MRVLVVEDDQLLLRGLLRVLVRAGHAAEHARTGADADALLKSNAYDLVVLDIGLPVFDGFEVLRRVRERKSTCNVLVLTARDAVEDRVHGLDLGADDYLTKPFSITEFEARVRALLRRPPLVPPITQICSLKIDEAAKRVEVGGKAVDLTPREWSLLEIFLRRLGRVMSKEQIAQHLNAIGDPLSDNAIEVYVSRLRSKIEPSGVQIRTVRGFGYLCEVEA
jgi:two-component system OmpR family response regulator